MFGSTDQSALYSDRAFGALPPLRARSYPSDSELDLYLAHDVLEHLPRHSNLVFKLQDPTLKCSRNLGWNIDWAVAFIIQHLTATGAAEAFRAIRKRAADLESAGLLQDVPYRIFNKLDEVLFAGHLRNAVYLDMHDLAFNLSGTTYTHGWGPGKEIKRISIILNSNTFEYGTARDIVATLIHHMIHAYFLVACGPQKEDDVNYGRLGHGVHFGKILLAIKKLSAAHGKELTTLKFSHHSRRPHYFADDIYFPYNKASVGREDGGDWYCSHCNGHVEELSESEVDGWYKKVCKPMFDQHTLVRSPQVHIYNDHRNELELKHRAQLLPSAKSIEFIFKDKLVQVESKKIDDLVNVRKAFERAESRYLEIDKSTSEATFMRFLEFVHTNSYRPDPALFAALSSGFGMWRRGPPIIKPRSSSTDTPLLADIDFARFASLMGFDECRRYALGRMNSYGILYEDPVNVLKAIYHGHEPDAETKAWARTFLRQAPAPMLSGYDLNTTEPPNLLKLEQESGSHRTRFFEAVDCSGALENDVNKARAGLKALGWYNYAPLPLRSTDVRGTAPCGSCHHAPLTLGSTRCPPLLTDGYTSPFGALPSLYPSIPSLSTADRERLREYERLKELERARERDRWRAKERCRELEITKLKLRELEGDVDRKREGEREKERESKEREKAAQAQAYTVAYLERFVGRRMGGFVEDHGDGQ